MPAGFYDALVAAPSQKAALKAWGTTTDLFAAGRASLVEDPDDIATALTRPGEVVRRPRGNAKALISEMEREQQEAVPRRPAPRAEPAPPLDRSELDAAEQALATAEREIAATIERLAAERAELDRREQSARQDGDRRLRELGRAVARARAAYDRAAAAHRS